MFHHTSVSSRFTVVDDEIDGLRITIPHATDPRLFLVHAGVAAFWVVLGMVALIRGPADGLPARVASILMPALVGIIFMCSSMIMIWYFWMFRSRDVILVDGRLLTLRRELGPVSETKGFEPSDVRRIRFDPPITIPFRTFHSRDLGSGGSIAFESGGKTHRFGLDLPEADAQKLIAWILPHCKESGKVIHA
jgi:hypothetical protein